VDANIQNKFVKLKSTYTFASTIDNMVTIDEQERLFLKANKIQDAVRIATNTFLYGYKCADINERMTYQHASRRMLLTLKREATEGNDRKPIGKEKYAAKCKPLLDIIDEAITLTAYDKV
jgi:hypothetical protein